MDSKLQKNIQQYIQLVYSEKSELNIIENLEERKKKACEKAKLDYASEAVQKIIHIKDKEANTLIFEHCRTTCSNEFYLYMADQHLFWEQTQILMEPLKKITEDGKTEEIDEEAMMKRTNLKDTISRNCEKLLERLNTRRLSIFKGEAESKMAAEKIRSLRPEQRLKKNKS
jgi:hypothetical protein